MSPQGGASGKVARSIKNIWNTTTQHYQQQTQQQQAGAEPGHTQEAPAGFCKGPETPHIPLYQDASPSKITF